MVAMNRARCKFEGTRNTFSNAGPLAIVISRFS